MCLRPPPPVCSEERGVTTRVLLDIEAVFDGTRLKYSESIDCLGIIARLETVDMVGQNGVATHALIGFAEKEPSKKFLGKKAQFISPFLPAFNRFPLHHLLPRDQNRNYP